MYLERKPLALKGLEGAVRVMQVVVAPEQTETALPVSDGPKSRTMPPTTRKRR
jgi:hypothetical protein